MISKIDNCLEDVSMLKAVAITLNDQDFSFRLK